MVKKHSPSSPPTTIRCLKPQTIIKYVNSQNVGLITYFLIETKTVLFEVCIKENKIYLKRLSLHRWIRQPTYANVETLRVAQGFTGKSI